MPEFFLLPVESDTLGAYLSQLWHRVILWLDLAAWIIVPCCWLLTREGQPGWERLSRDMHSHVQARKLLIVDQGRPTIWTTRAIFRTPSKKAIIMPFSTRVISRLDVFGAGLLFWRRLRISRSVNHSSMRFDRRVHNHQGWVGTQSPVATNFMIPYFWQGSWLSHHKHLWRVAV